MSRSFGELSVPVKETYWYVCAFWREHSHAPSVRDVVKATGASSTSVASYRMKVLEGEGYLERICNDHAWLRPVGGV